MKALCYPKWCLENLGNCALIQQEARRQRGSAPLEGLCSEAAAGGAWMI